jgi:hypothetical protein
VRWGALRRAPPAGYVTPAGGVLDGRCPTLVLNAEVQTLVHWSLPRRHLWGRRASTLSVVRAADWAGRGLKAVVLERTVMGCCRFHNWTCSL